MPRTEQTNEKLRSEQRLKILNAAKNVFAKKGRATTIADIAAEAHVSQGLAYRYFVSKEEIFTTIVTEAAGSGGGPAARIAQIKGTPGTRLALLITYTLENYRDNPGVSQVMYNVLEDESAPSDLKVLVQKNGKIIQDLIRQLIIEGQATGEVVKDDPDQLMVALLASFVGLMKRATILDPKDAKTHFPDAKIILRMLKPDERRGDLK